MIVSAVAVCLAMAQLAAAPVPRSDIIVIEDFSGSLDTESFGEVRANLGDELPTIVETFNVQRLEVRSFDADGWKARRIAERTFTELKLTSDEKQPADEAAVFKTVKDAVAKERADREAREFEERRNSYRRRLARELKGVAPIPGPPTNYTSPTSDIVGAFRYIASIDAVVPTYVFLITDLADTNVRELSSRLPPPRAFVRVFVIFVPANASDIKATLGPLTGSQQFDLRTRQLQAAVPWATLLPHTTRRYTDVLRTYQTKNK